MNTLLIIKAGLIAAFPLLLSGCGEQETMIIEPGTVPKTLPSTLKIKREATTYVITGIGFSGSNDVMTACR